MLSDAMVQLVLPSSDNPSVTWTIFLPASLPLCPGRPTPNRVRSKEAWTSFGEGDLGGSVPAKSLAQLRFMGQPDLEQNRPKLSPYG